MKKYLLVLFLFPIIGLGQSIEQCYPYVLGSDSVVYCVTDANCYGSCDGQLEINIYGPENPYRFIIGASPDTLSNGTIIDTLCPGTYSILVLDRNNNLVDVKFLDINAPSELVIYSDLVMNPSCHDYNDGSISISTFGNTPFSWNWSNGEITDDISGINSGIYVLTTTDGNSCSRIDTFELINPPVVISTTVSDTLSCIGLCDGTGIVTASNGVAPYTYQWSNGDTNSIATGLCYGVNTIYITDNNDCLDTNEVFIYNPDTLQLGNITIDSSCYNICDGKLSATIVGGETPYYLEWSLNGNIFNTTDTITNDDLCPGNYQIKFTDANDCVDSVIIPLIERDSFIVQDWIIDDSCYNSCTGQIKVQLLNKNNPPFIFDWSNGVNDTAISNLCSDTFNLVIIDNKLCRDTSYYFVGTGDSMYFDSVAVTHNRCYGDENGAISLTNLNGGIQPLYYLWSNSEITSGINSLPSGLYSVTVTDANGCSLDSSNINVSQPDSLFATTSSMGNVSCFGASDGLIDVDIFGGVEPYFISWDMLIPDSTLIDTVPAGEYIYTIIDSNLCTLSDTLIIEEPNELIMSDSLVHILCKGESTGEIHITVTGGIAPYNYSIDNGVTFQSQSYFDNLSAGAYSIIVKDGNNCLLNSPLYNITEPLTILTTSITTPNLLCSGDTGTIILLVNGGTPNYSFLWANGAVSQNLYGIGAGNFSVTILDENNCEVIENITIIEPDMIQSDPNPVITHVDCFGDNTGSINMSIIGGTNTYNYSIDNEVTFQSQSHFDNLGAGTYSITVRDGNDCRYIESITVEEPDLLEVTYVRTHVDCHEGNTGGIDITVSGGTAAYIFDWSNLNSNEDLINIPAGTYELIISDANNCTLSTAIDINEPSEIVFNINTVNLICEGIDGGQISISSISGGTPAYEYSINGVIFQPSANSFDNLSSGNYTIVIRDQNGCMKDSSVILDEPIGYSTIVNLEDVEGCNGDATGSINFSVSGNTPPYSYNWSNGESTSSIYNITAGTYNIEVTDANYCSINYSYVIMEPIAMTLSYTVTPASCAEKYDGSIITFVTGGANPITYEWGNNENTADIYNLQKGTYSLLIEDGNGCTLPLESIEVEFEGYDDCIEIPSGFTPNNDNIHDEWRIGGIDDYPNILVKVYNRWGQEVFSSRWVIFSS